MLSVELATEHRCVLRKTGSLRCWGSNTVGQLGATPSAYDDVEHSDRDFVQVSTSGGLTCATTAGGDVWCWGDNSYGQVGPNGVADPCGGSFCSPAPVKVDGLGQVEEVHVSGVHACALQADKTVACWGFNGNGNLGDGSIESRAMPKVVDLPTNIAVLAVHPDSYASSATCAITVSGELYCWGGGQVLFALVNEPLPELDQSSECQCSFDPNPIHIQTLDTPVLDFKFGLYHACALGPSNSVTCWGASDPPRAGCGADRENLCTNMF